MLFSVLRAVTYATPVIIGCERAAIRVSLSGPLWSRLIEQTIVEQNSIMIWSCPSLWGLLGKAFWAIQYFHVGKQRWRLVSKTLKEACYSILTTGGNGLLLDSVPPNILWSLEGWCLGKVFECSFLVVRLIFSGHNNKCTRHRFCFNPRVKF